MTDVSQAPAAPISAAPPPAGSAPTLEDNLNTVLKVAPIVSESPGLAVGIAASGGDPQVRAESVGRGVQAISDSQAKARVAQSTGSGLSDALNWLGNHIAHAAGDVGHTFADGAKTVGHDVMGALNAPLSVVQHEYRYLHDVEASHGMTAAILEGIGIAGGAVAGGIAGGGAGAVLGAEAASGIEGQLFYHDSWQRTGKASYVDPHTHQPVSIGRDVVSFLNSHGIVHDAPGSTYFKLSSGLIDGIFDMSVGGPELGALAKATQGGARAGGLLGNYFSGTAPQSAEDVYRAFTQYGSVRRAFGDIASKTAGEIAATPAYEPLARDRGLLTSLGNAQTPEDVADVFAGVMQAHGLAFTRNLPTLTATRVPFQALRQYAENAGGPLGAVAQRFTRLPDSWQTVEGQMKQISAHEFDPSSTLDNGAVGLYRMLRYTESRQVAANVVDQYINAPNLEARVNIFRNTQLNLLFKMAGFSGNRDQYLAQFANPNHREAMAAVLDNLVGGGQFGKQAIYGVDDQGRILSLVRHSDTSWQYGAALTENQTGNLHFLDLAEAKRAAKMLDGAQQILDSEGKSVLAKTLAGGDLGGRLGDFAYHHITQGIFKPLVLLTPSYAMHISLAELIPNTLRLGVLNMIRDGIAINVAKLGDKSLYYGVGQERVSAAADDLAHAIDSGQEDRIAVAEERLRIVQREARKMGYAGRIDHALSGMAWRMIDHLTNGKVRDLIENPEAIANTAMGKRLQLAARYIEYNDGYAPSALLSGHYSATEVGQREEVAARLMRHAVGSSPSKLGEGWRRFGPDDAGMIDAWQAWLKEIASDGASREAAKELLAGARSGKSLDEASVTAAQKAAEYLRNQPEEWKGRFLRSNPELSAVSKDGRPYVTSFAGELPAGMDQYDDWARNLVANLRGATRGQDGTLHVPLLDKIANGDPDLPETLWFDRHTLQRIPEDQRPRYVKGQELVPDGSSHIQRIANVGFRRVLNPMVNFLSRQPIAFAQFEKEWNQLAPLVEHGRLAEDEAMTLAMNRTVQEVIRNVHNIHDRTQWSVLLRNWAPFYFAQEQAYRRFGRLLAENPAAFRKYELMIANVHDIGQIYQGQNGNGYFVMPGTGFLASGPARAANTLFGGIAPVETSTPIGMGWNLSGSSVIFPLSSGFRPDPGPLVSIPVQAVAQFFPEMGAPALKADLVSGENAVLGGAAASQDLWSQFVPNVIAQRLLTATGAIDQRSFMSTMMQTLQTLDYQHQLPGPNAGYMKWQQFIDRVKNQTRIMYIAKALYGAVTPVSPEITNPDYVKFSGELATDIQRTGSVTKGIQEFLLKNPDATPYTVFHSYSPTGATPPDSVQAEQWINDNAAFIRDNPYSAFYFMPQPMSTKYDASVYNAQVAQGYRVKYDPTANPVNHIGSSFLAQLYIAAGNAFVYDNPENYPLYKQQMSTLIGQEKYQAYLNWQAFLQQVAKQNPVWGEYYGANTKQADRTQAIQEIQKMIAEKTIPNPDSQQTKGIVGLMHDYQTYQGQLAAGRQDAFATQSQSAINQQWDDYLLSVAQDHPELRAFINGVFFSLPQNIQGSK